MIADPSLIDNKVYATQKQQLFEKYQTQSSNMGSRSKLSKMEEKHNSMISE